MTIKNLKFALIFLLLCSFIGCNNQPEQVIPEDTSTENNINTEETSSDDLEQNSDYQFIPPSPIQIGLILEKAGMDYIPDIANPANNVEDYTDKFRQSICFGVYSCDLAYCVLNEKYDEASEYLKSIKTLGGKIGLETVFKSEDIVTRFEQNIGNKDSIVDILIYVQENTDAYIDDNGMDDLSVIYFSGAWIEGMYLGVETLAKDSDRNVSILLSEQMGILELLLAGIENIADKSEDINELNSVVTELLEAYNNLESIQISAEHKDNLDIDLTSEEIELISGKIVDIRQSLVQ
jgi:hypothetical protein